MSGGDFWSRRKAAVAAETVAEEHAAEQAEAALREAAFEERTDADILAELELPDPDTLEQGDDFKAFLSNTVPARIRTRALRRLWATNPVLANVDGLVDYGGDFTDASCVIDKLQTAYQVGRGMTKHVEELARQAERVADVCADETPDVAPEEVTEPVPEASPVLAAIDAGDEGTEEPPVAHAAAQDTDDAGSEELAPPPVPRRMRFAFDDAGHTERTETA